MIKQFIFDIGNVLVDFHPEVYFEHQMPNKNMKEVCRFVFNDIWQELDRGSYLQAEAMRLHIELHPEYEEQIRFIYAHWLSMMSLKEDTFAYMLELKKEGYEVYLLSNIGEESHRYLQQQFDFFDEADGMVLSYQERVIKPDTKIYEILLERYQLQADECIFFDDKIKNVETANTLGIHGVLFENVKQVQKEILNKC